MTTRAADPDDDVCPRCKGRKNVRGLAVDGSNRMPCPECNGSGKGPADRVGAARRPIDHVNKA